MFVSAFFVKTNLFQLITDLHFYDCDLFMFINVCFLFSKKLSRRSLLRDCRPAKHIITDFDQKRKLSRYSRFTELEDEVFVGSSNPTPFLNSREIGSGRGSIHKNLFFCFEYIFEQNNLFRRIYSRFHPFYLPDTGMTLIC